MTQSQRISYVIMAALVLLAGVLRMGTLVLTFLFGYFALCLFQLRGSKTVAVILYFVTVAVIGYGLFFFSKKAYKALPEIADKTIPAVVNYAEKQGIELGFTDYESLKKRASEEVNEQRANLAHYARKAGFQFAMLLIGLIGSVSLFLNSGWKGDPDAAMDSVYSTVMRDLFRRFELFYESFAKVMSAQLTIAFINTVLTAVFLIWAGFPYAIVLVGLTFLCGLLPIVGNLISNTLIVGVAFTISPRTALFALIFLVVIHKLEYFLNSKIIGARIKNPMWLTLIALVLGEKLMGIPGMVLAPVFLHYIKIETARKKLSDAPDIPKIVRADG